jgi:cation transporter-like permease
MARKSSITTAIVASLLVVAVFAAAWLLGVFGSSTNPRIFAAFCAFVCVLGFWLRPVGRWMSIAARQMNAD